MKIRPVFIVTWIFFVNKGLIHAKNTNLTNEAIFFQKTDQQGSLMTPSRSLFQQRMMGELPLEGEIHCSVAEGCRLGVQNHLSVLLDFPGFFRSHLYQEILPGQWNYWSGGLGLQALRSHQSPLTLALTGEAFQTLHRNSDDDRFYLSGFKGKLIAQVFWNDYISSDLSLMISRSRLKYQSDVDFEKQALRNSIEVFSTMIGDLIPQYRLQSTQEFKLYALNVPSDLWPSHFKISLLMIPSWQFSELRFEKIYLYEEHQAALRVGPALNLESLSDSIGHWSLLFAGGVEARSIWGLERGPEIIQEKKVVASWMNLGMNYKFF
jgi:hypothetical protein